MCEMCETPNHAHAIAGKLRDLSSSYTALARGSIKPHTKEARKVALRAQAVIRELAQDWL